MDSVAWASLAALAILAAASTDQVARVKAQLDRRPRKNEKPFAPAHNSTVKINPPAFRWLPLDRRPRAYLLEASRSRNFPPKSTLRFRPPVSLHIPHQPLEPGRWHWRVGVTVSGGQVVWSKTRSFTVPAEAEKWPFPKIEDLVARVPKSHPRLFFPGKKLAEVRALCKGPLRKQLQALARAARREVGKPLVPEPDYIRAKGTERGRVYAHIFRTTRPPMNAMETCALAYLLSGDRALGLEAKRRILHFFSWDPNGPTSLFHNDEPAMWVMQRGTRAYDWTYDLFTPAERRKVEAVMKVRSLQFLKRLTRMPYESRPFSSHPARDLGFLGEAALCFIHEWPEAREWLDYVIKIYRGTFPAWGGDDGGWQEGPGYWRAYMSFALHFVVALKNATGEDLARKPFFRNTPYFALYCNPPFARMSPFGDGQHNAPGRGAGYLMYQFSTVLRDPHVRWYADVLKSGPGSGPLGFALYDPTVRAGAPSDLPQARAFPSVGLVAMHTNLADPANDAYLLVRSSPYGSVSHGHADQNAFCIEAYGEALAIASGYYPWYSSPHHHNWTRETKAKNCITIDGGQGQVKRSWEATGRIVRFIHNDRFDYALGDASRAYGGKLTRFLRHVVHIRPGVFVIADELEAPRPVTFEWWLHALEKMAVEPKARRVLIRRARARLQVDFIAPRALRFVQTDKFTPPPEDGKPNQWHLTASTEKCRSVVFFTVLRPHPAKEEGRLPKLTAVGGKGIVGVRWRDARGTHEIVHTPTGMLINGTPIVQP